MKKLTLSLGIILTLLMLVMLALSFFQSPSFDDYVPVYLKEQFGGFGSIQWYLTERNGRYATIPIFMLIAASPQLMALYPLLLITFILFSIFAIYRLLLISASLLFSSMPHPGTLILLSGSVIFTFLAMIPEPASYYFWFASAITYLFPFSIFLFYLSAWISFFRTEKKWRNAIVLMILTLFLGGCNEVMMYFAFVLPFLIIVMQWTIERRAPAQLYWIAAVALLMAVIVLRMPGNGSRTHHYHSTQSVLTSLTGSVFRSFKFWLILFSNPLFYISCIGMIIACSFLKPAVGEWFSRKRTSWYVEFLVLVALMLGFDLVIRQLANNVIPARATNILVCLSLIGCWWIIIMNAWRFPDLSSLLKQNINKVMPVFYCVFIAGILGSGYFRELVSNIITLPTHQTVLMTRVSIIQDAKKNGRNIAILPPYYREVERELNRRFGGKARFVKEEFRFPPSFAYFKDEPFNKDYAYFYAEYYHIDTIATDTSKYARWGLTNISGY